MEGLSRWGGIKELEGLKVDMIVEYNRPKTLEEALALLQRADPCTVPIGGGSALDRSSLEPIAVVDLQALGLNHLQQQGNVLEVGATATLQALLDQDGLQPALREAIEREASYNQRQAASIAGVLVAADGRSPFATALMALDAQLTLTAGNQAETQISLGDLLPVRVEKLRGRLIVQVKFPLNARLAYQSVARTPADRPIVCAAAAQWPSQRTRLALGGFGRAPVLAMDGPEADGAEAAARNAYQNAGDAWGAADYRSEAAGVLARRCMEGLQSG